MKVIALLALAGCLVAPSPALAETQLAFTPIEEEGSNVRYLQGVATLDREDEAGGVQMTPIGLDHGRLTFAVSVLNLSSASDNFGVEDIQAVVGDQALPVLTRDRLDKMAKNRAMWAQIGMAVASGLAAGAAASTRDTYRATTYTPHGTYHTVISTPSIGGQIAADNAARDGGYAIASIQARLDETRQALANEIVQTTTVNPQDSYSGRFVIEKFKGKWPQEVHLTVNFAGHSYPFTFNVSKK